MVINGSLSVELTFWIVLGLLKINSHFWEHLNIKIQNVGRVLSPFATYRKFFRFHLFGLHIFKLFHFDTLLTHIFFLWSYPRKILTIKADVLVFCLCAAQLGLTSKILV